VHQADRISAPLLVVHGQADFVVPPLHARVLRAKLNHYDKDYEWLLKEHEGHGFRKPENIREFYLKMEAFLAKHLARRVP
jgi:dipeptidyl aminopeptidase/acylaminoacyl peptidase